MVKGIDNRLMETEEILSLEDVWKRVPLLRRVARDVVDTYRARAKWKDFLDELTIIHRKFSSPEIVETMNRLRRDVVQADRNFEDYEKEVRSLGGVLKDSDKGLIYFHAKSDGRRIFLIWEIGEPELVSWHELDEDFSDRVPAQFPEGTEASLKGK